jgi:hypothetical protein
MTTALATTDDLKALSETLSLKPTALSTVLKFEAQTNSIVIRMSATDVAGMARARGSS